VAVLQPRWMKIIADFRPRGGITTRVTAQYRVERM
jgi:NADPH-dependent 7-cyano-7-deazaguanine reductase QueF